MITSASRTHVGAVRTENEDRFFVSNSDSSPFFAVLCDGMGGMASGELAAEAGAAALMEGVANRAVTADSLRETLDEANRCARGIEGAGSTLVALVLDPVTSRGYRAHVGDSRLYRFRDRLEQLTRDHNLGEELRERGVLKEGEKLNPRYAAELTRHLGMEEFPGGEIAEIEALAGDLFLLTSDGLTNALSDDEIAECLSGRDAEGAVENLLQSALARSPSDNITVVTVRIE